MKLDKVAALLLVCIGLFLSRHLSAQAPPNTLNNALGKRNVTLPFTVQRGYLILVEGRVASLSRRLILDTGTTSTVLDRSVARQLGLGGRETRLTLLNGDERVKTGVLPSLTLGPVVAKELPVFIADLSFLTKELGTRIDGIVGLDVLKSSSFTIDYDKREIVFGPVQSSPAAVPFESGPPLVSVASQIDNRAVRLLIDTGASGLLLFGDHAGWSEPVRRKEMSSSLAGSFTRDEVQLNQLKVGRLQIRNQKAFLVRANKGTAPDIDGLMGVGALGVKQIAFDFEHQRLEISK